MSPVELVFVGAFLSAVQRKRAYGRELCSNALARSLKCEARLESKFYC